ncbi:MAG: hypothetical protein RI924_1256 [Bacteroidota bacterium]|jgi:anhydro-N-acetylmuramic acid kinase
MNSSVQLLQNISTKPERRILGLMSGTSLDGLDLALCRISGSGLQTNLVLEFHQTIPYSAYFKEEIRSIFAKEVVSLEKLSLLNAFIATQHADWVLQCLADWGLKPAEVDAIASHGQTVYHAPIHFHQKQGYPNATLQIGDGDHIAFKTGILTLSDFRQKHVAAGGEGAPLAVYGDYLLFSSTEENRILLNLGGMANFTFLPQDGDASKIVCTDVGPANTLIDAAVRAYFHQDFDRGGQIALAGKVNQEFLNALLKHPFFGEDLPKSTGPEMFSWEWMSGTLSNLNLAISPEDIVSTLSQLSVEGIVGAIKQGFHPANTKLYVSGGGTHNAYLMQQLQKALPQLSCQSLSGLGIPADAKEAVLFAVLANEALAGEGLALGNLPSIRLGKLSFPN